MKETTYVDVYNDNDEMITKFQTTATYKDLKKWCTDNIKGYSCGRYNKKRWLDGDQTWEHFLTLPARFNFNNKEDAITFKLQFIGI